MQFLELVLKIIGATIALVSEIRALRRESPFLHSRPVVTTPRRLILDQEPIPKQEPAKEEKPDMMEFQIEIEKLFSKNQLMPRIRKEFKECSDANFEAYMIEKDINPDFGFDLLAQMVLHKRADLPTLVGALRKHFGGDCQLTTDELYKAAAADLVDWSPINNQFIIRFGITAEVQADLDRYQYPLPMVIEPKELKNNKDTGYYTGSGSAILKQNHHDEDICLDHLNKMNRIKLRINQQVALTIKNRWKNLDKQKPDEEVEDYEKRVKAFQKYDRTSKDVLDMLGVSTGGEFYLTHKVDKRGRTYSQGYHVNYQGADWNKAVIEFANQEICDG